MTTERYGLLIGPQSSDEEITAFCKNVEAKPRGYIAQEVVVPSRHPTLCGDRLEGRHVASVSRVHENARSVRELVPTELW